jgi:hypothetical protein
MWSWWQRRSQKSPVMVVKSSRCLKHLKPQTTACWCLVHTGCWNIISAFPA